MRPQQARLGIKVRVSHKHRIATWRGMVGRVVNRYGGEEYMAVDVRLANGHRRLFWPEDLEELSGPRPWWRSLILREGPR